MALKCKLLWMASESRDGERTARRTRLSENDLEKRRLCAVVCRGQANVKQAGCAVTLSCTESI